MKQHKWWTTVTVCKFTGTIHRHRSSHHVSCCKAQWQQLELRGLILKLHLHNHVIGLLQQPAPKCSNAASWAWHATRSYPVLFGTCRYSSMCLTNAQPAAIWGCGAIPECCTGPLAICLQVFCAWACMTLMKLVGWQHLHYPMPFCKTLLL